MCAFACPAQVVLFCRVSILAKFRSSHCKPCINVRRPWIWHINISLMDSWFVVMGWWCCFFSIEGPFSCWLLQDVFLSPPNNHGTRKEGYWKSLCFSSSWCHIYSSRDAICEVKTVWRFIWGGCASQRSNIWGKWYWHVQHIAYQLNWFPHKSVELIPLSPVECISTEWKISLICMTW